MLFFNFSIQYLKDRAYFVKINGKYKELKMSSVLIKSLGHLNTKDNRKKTDLDLTFVQVLLIGLCTSKAIKQNEPIQKDVLIFIKGDGNIPGIEFF